MKDRQAIVRFDGRVVLDVVLSLLAGMDEAP